MSEAAVEAAVRALPLPDAPLILDVGCGTGEMLIRAVGWRPGARGVGADIDPDAIAEARVRSGDLPVHFEVKEAQAVDGSYDAVFNVGASHVYGEFPAALVALRALAPVILYGEGFWRRAPTDEFLAALGGATRDELPDLAQLRAAVRDLGLELVDEWLAGDADWAHYEETLAANAELNGSPESLAYARRIRERRALPGGTDTLGFGLFLLRRL